MNWDTIQQLIRIIAYTFGGMVFGTGVTEGEQFQILVGGILAVGSFIWWYFWNRNIEIQ
jgi:hypothetical protein